MYSQEDIQSLAKCGWLEARSDGLSGMHAVMHCIKNRVAAPDFPDTVSGVILQKNAFSWTRPDDPQYGMEPKDFPPANLWTEAQRLAELILNTDDADPTRGALYYANRATTPAGWFTKYISGDTWEGTANHPFTVQIGHHRFFK